VTEQRTVWFTYSGEINEVEIDLMMKFGASTAKLDKKLLRAFAKRKLSISKLSLHLMIRLTPLVDYDGRIHMDSELLRKKLFLTHDHLKRLLFELLNTSYEGKALLTFEDGHYISHFHVISNGENTYQQFIPFLLDPEFMNLSLNQTRIFLYVLTNNNRNQYNEVAIENLYHNKLHDKDFGLDVYKCYRSLVEDLFYLNDAGFVQIRFYENDELVTLEPNSTSHKKVFNTTFGYINNRKGRTSKFLKKSHKVGVKVNPRLMVDKAETIRNYANLAELYRFAERCHIFREDIKQETYNYLISYKNALVDLFGQTGLNIYLSTLDKYFREKGSDITYYDLKDKAANVYMDYYLLNEIKRIILHAIKFSLGEKGALASSGYVFEKNDIKKLVEFYVARSGDEHKVLIDQDIQLIEKARDLMDPLNIEMVEEHWVNLDDSISAVYDKYDSMFHQALATQCLKLGTMPSYGLTRTINFKEMIVELAQKSMLSKKEEIEKEVEKLKDVILFFKKKQRKNGPQKTNSNREAEIEELFRNYDPNWLGKKD
jgi:hypothetical protein